ncbi:MAG: phosphoribosylanthranilate isomerase [Clostridiaceae bacterium]
MTKVKICGLTRYQDIKYVNELKPEYIGFVFAKSKRQVTLVQALELRKNLNKETKTVGVFVNESIKTVKEIAFAVKLDVLQFHGNEDREYINNFNDFEVWKALPVKNKNDLAQLDKFQNIRLLIDSKVEGAQGGSGKTFDWNILKDSNLKHKIILAGGLNCENIAKAIGIIQPYAVDVSSGVEINGIKDYQKMKEFIEKAREA